MLAASFTPFLRPVHEKASFKPFQPASLSVGLKCFDSVSFTGKSSDKAAPSDDSIKEKLSHALKTGNLGPLVEGIFGGDLELIEETEKFLNGIKSRIKGEHSCLHTTDEDGLPVVKIRANGKDLTLKNMQNIYSADETDFEDMLERELKGKTVVKLSLTGWTQPPFEPLNQDRTFKSRLRTKKTVEEKQAYAESIYVDMAKQYLRDVFKIVKGEFKELEKTSKDHKFNNSDIVFLYGVTPQGIDRAIKEFADEEGIKCVGITTYKWLSYFSEEELDNLDNNSPIFVAEDTEEFTSLLSENAYRLFVFGGNSIASNITEKGESVFGDNKEHRIVPVDLLQRRGINLPSVSLDPTIGKSVITNASKVLTAEDETNPKAWKDLENTKDRANGDFDLNISSELIIRDLLSILSDRKTEK